MLLRRILLPCLLPGTGSCSVLAKMELVAASWLMRGASGWHVLAPDATAGAAILPCTLLADTCEIPMQRLARLYAGKRASADSSACTLRRRLATRL